MMQAIYQAIAIINLRREVGYDAKRERLAWQIAERIGLSFGEVYRALESGISEEAILDRSGAAK